jgi:hypothetical protein
MYFLGYNSANGVFVNSFFIFIFFFLCFFNPPGWRNNEVNLMALYDQLTKKMYNTNVKSIREY